MAVSTIYGGSISSRLYPYSYPQAGRDPPELAGAHRSNRSQPEPAGRLPRFRDAVPSLICPGSERESGLFRARGIRRTLICTLKRARLCLHGAGFGSRRLASAGHPAATPAVFGATDGLDPGSSGICDLGHCTDQPQLGLAAGVAGESVLLVKRRFEASRRLTKSAYSGVVQPTSKDP